MPTNFVNENVHAKTNPYPSKTKNLILLLI